MPVPWLQAVDSLAPLVMMPPIVWLWRRQARRGHEPDDIGKLGIGCLMFGAGMAWLGGAGFATGADGKVPLVWAPGFHLISNVGWVYFTPTAVALYVRTAPAAVNALMIGIYYLVIFAGSTVSGRLGVLYERLSSGEFWLLHAAIVATGGLLMFALAGTLRRELRPSLTT